MPLAAPRPLVGPRPAVRRRPAGARGRAGPGVAQQGRGLRHLLAAVVPRERGRGRRHAPARRRCWARWCTPWPSWPAARRPLDLPALEERLDAVLPELDLGAPWSVVKRRQEAVEQLDPVRALGGAEPARAGRRRAGPGGPARRAGGPVRPGRPARARRAGPGRRRRPQDRLAPSRRRPSSPATRSSASTSWPPRSAPSPTHGLTEPGGAVAAAAQEGQDGRRAGAGGARRRRRARLGARPGRARGRRHERLGVPRRRQRPLPHLQGPHQLPRVARGHRGAAVSARCWRGGPSGRCRSTGWSTCWARRSAPSRPRSSPPRSRPASSWPGRAAARPPRWSPGSPGWSAAAWSPPTRCWA